MMTKTMVIITTNFKLIIPRWGLIALVKGVLSPGRSNSIEVSYSRVQTILIFKIVEIIVGQKPENISKRYMVEIK